MRIDKYGRQLFASEMRIYNSVSITKETPDSEEFVGTITGSGMDFHSVAVDLLEGNSQVPIVPVETPNIAALISIGAWSLETQQAFALMVHGAYLALDSEEYKAALEAQNVE